MMSLRDKDTPFTTKQEADDHSNKAASLGPRQWSSGFKNPRIVRVSRTFGGKDRHSKVCTIKGLRDRRIRLSVNTAIQLYDIQDRLGLSQPSKAIDWLLDVTKNDIDKLPPLPIIPGGFTPFHQTTHTSQGYGGPQSSSSIPFLDANLVHFRKEGLNINSQSLDVNEDDQSLMAKLKYWESNAVMRSKQKGVDNQGGIEDQSNSSQVIAAQNFFPIARGNNNASTILPPPTTLLSNNPMFNYFHWEPPNLSLTQLGSHGLASQNDHQSNNSTSLPSSSSLISSGSQFLLYPSIATTPSLFQPYPSLMNAHHQVDNELRQINRLHFSNSVSSSLHNNPSSSLGLKPFPFSMNHHPHLQQHDERHQDKLG